MKNKKRWRIEDTGEGDFSLSRFGAYFYFDKMWESVLNWHFYYKGNYVGVLFKMENKIMNFKKFKEKIPSREAIKIE